MADFKTYEEARAFAQQRANASGISQGLEKNTALPGYGPWVVHILPRKENRYGWELLCEVVDPENLRCS